MNDFLQQLRSNSEKRFNKKRRQYDNNQNLVYDRRNNQETRRSIQRNIANPEHISAISLDMITTIRDLLEKFTEGHERLIAAEEKKTTILEGIGEALKTLAKDGFTQQQGKGGALYPDYEAAKLAKRQVKIDSDPNRKRVMQIISEMREINATYQEIAQKLEEEKLPTFSGRGKWHAQTVHRLCQD